MKPSKELHIQRQNDTAPKSCWIDYICDDSLRLAIPVGPRFQASLPALPVSPHKNSQHNSNSKRQTLKWLSIKVWPTKGRSMEVCEGIIGIGRPKSCSCISPGSVECVRQHINAKKMQLQSDLGPAFWHWKFDSMGENASKMWTLEEQKKFGDVVRMHAKSSGPTLIMSALKCLPCQSRETIINYYLNVHIPRRIAKQTRLGCSRIDTDDESDDTPPSKGSRKRLQANHVASSVSKCTKAKFLMGRR